MRLLTEENIKMTVDLSAPLGDEVYEVKVMIVGIDGIQFSGNMTITVELIEVQEE